MATSRNQSAWKAPQSKRTHGLNRLFMALTDASQLLFKWRPPGAVFGGESLPRVASHFVLLTTGLLLYGASRRPPRVALHFVLLTTGLLLYGASRRPPRVASHFVLLTTGLLLYGASRRPVDLTSRKSHSCYWP